MFVKEKDTVKEMARIVTEMFELNECNMKMIMLTVQEINVKEKKVDDIMEKEKCNEDIKQKEIIQE
jgi:hypothetical protein